MDPVFFILISIGAIYLFFTRNNKDFDHFNQVEEVDRDLIKSEHTAELAKIAADVTELLKKSYSSNLPHEKRRLFFDAKNGLELLKSEIKNIPGGYLTNLEKFEKNIDDIEDEYYETGIFRRNLFNGFVFKANLKLETRLEALVHHGVYVKDKSEIEFKPSLDDGAWFQKLSTFEELGLDTEEVPASYIASEVGPIPENGGDYYRFLLELREIAENNDWDTAINLIEKLLSENHLYNRFVIQLGGLDKVKSRLLKSLKKRNQ